MTTWTHGGMHGGEVIVTCTDVIGGGAGTETARSRAACMWGSLGAAPGSPEPAP